MPATSLGPISDELARRCLELAGEAPQTPTLPPLPLRPEGRVNPTEADFTRQVIDLARSRRWRAAHFRPAMTKAGKWVTAVQGDGKGFPDLVLVRGGSVLVAELKVGKNRPTGEQAAWLAAFAAAGVPAYTWRPCDWVEIVSALA